MSSGGSRKASRSGTVLLVVAVIVMLLSLAAYKFMLSMQTEHMAVALSGDRIQAQQAAYSVRDLMMIMLESSREQRERMGGLQDNPLYFGGNPQVLVAGASELTAVSSATPMTEFGGGEAGTLTGNADPFGTIAYAVHASTRDQSEGLLESSTSIQALSSTTTDESTGSTLPVGHSSGASLSPLGQAQVGPPTRYGAKNESARLHLVKLLEWEEANPGDGVAALMQLPGMDQASAESILDWLDEDDEPRASGAESEFYAGLTRPLAPRNGLPPDLDELLFIQGVDAFRLFGIRTKDPIAMAMSGSYGLLPPNDTRAIASPSEGFSSTARVDMTESYSPREFASDDGLQMAQLPWSEYLTVYSAERNETYSGDSRLFVNQKNLKQLHQSLTKQWTKEVADFVVLYRQYGPVEPESESPEFPTRNETDPIRVSFEMSAQYEIENPLDLLGISVAIPAENEETESDLLPSPFGTATEVTQDFVEFLDEITLVREKRIAGRVNIIEAAPTVLMSLPGMSSEVVQAIMTDRQERLTRATSGSAADLVRKSPIWLLQEGIIDLDTMRVLWPNITCGGDVYRAEVWGYVDDRAPTVRFETVLDASQGPCRSVFHRELSAPKDRIQIKASAEAIAAAAESQPKETGFEEAPN